MTIQEARKVIGLNIHNLKGSMQMAVTTIMDALEEKAEIIGYLQPSEDLRQMVNHIWKCRGKGDPSQLVLFSYDEVGSLMRTGATWQKQQMLKDAVEGEVCGRVYDHINVRFADGVSKYLEPKNISHIPADISKYAIGDKVKIVIIPEKEDKK